MKKQCTSLFNKYKRKREGDEDVNTYKVKKKSSSILPIWLSNFTKDEKILYEICEDYPSIFTRHYKSLERIVYERDTLKKGLQPEFTWHFGDQGHGEMELADKYLNIYDTMTKVANYYLGLTCDKNII
jgi:hypothetical protein